MGIQTKKELPSSFSQISENNDANEEAFILESE
jgi:hypothetical protein